MSSTTIIIERTTSFKSFNFNKDPELFCLVDIRVKHLKYEDGDNVYSYSFFDFEHSFTFVSCLDWGCKDMDSTYTVTIYY